MNQGWIKLHRQFRESPYYRIGAAMQTWVECLLRASHEERTVFLKRERITLQKGQFVMGRDEFGQSIGISGSTAWYWLLQFESDNMVDIRKTAKGSIVSLKNWEEYQRVDSTVDNKKTADEQQMNTNKKDKKVENEKNTYVARPETQTLYDSIEGLCKQYNLEFNVNLKSLDVLVERYVGKIKMGVEAQHCISWLVGKNLRAVTTTRIGNWFKKAKEIQKRDQLKQLEWKEAKNNPAFAAKLKDQEVADSVNHFLQAQ